MEIYFIYGVIVIVVAVFRTVSLSFKVLKLYFFVCIILSPLRDCYTLICYDEYILRNMIDTNLTISDILLLRKLHWPLVYMQKTSHHFLQYRSIGDMVIQILVEHCTFVGKLTNTDFKLDRCIYGADHSGIHKSHVKLELPSSLEFLQQKL